MFILVNVIIYLFNTLIIYNFNYFYVCACMHRIEEALKNWIDHLKLELQVIMTNMIGLLGSKIIYSSRTVLAQPSNNLNREKKGKSDHLDIKGLIHHSYYILPEVM